jgi:hypothetical protein
MADAQRWEYRTVKVLKNNRRHQDKVVNKHARDGWELVEIKSAGFFGRHDHAILRRTKP